MNPFQPILERFSGLSTERLPGLRPPCPPVALEFDGRDMTLVRMSRKRKGKPVLETHKVRRVTDETEEVTSFHSSLRVTPELHKKIKELFEVSGTKPGKVSLILPDNMAKITLLNLPEKMASRRQLEEIVRFKLKRSIPFRLEDAVISYDLMPADGGGLNILAVLLRRAVVELYEKAIEQAGARPGMVDLCTTNLLNLSRPQLLEVCGGSGDAALLNLAQGYFSLVIVRNGKLIFYRCKNLPGKGDSGHLSREISNSIAYYEDKLEGQGLKAIFVRSVAAPLGEALEMAQNLNVPVVKPIDPTFALNLPEGVMLEPEVAQRIAPAVAAAAGRGR